MPNRAKKSSGDNWWEAASLFASSAQSEYEQLRQQFLDRAAESPIAAIQEFGSALLKAQIVHENMQVAQGLLDENGSKLEAYHAVQSWATTVTVETSAEFQKNFASDLAGVCKESVVSYRLQLLQVVSSPLNRLLKQLSGQS